MIFGNVDYISDSGTCTLELESMALMSLLVLLLSACVNTARARTFHDGEFVASARRSQFRQVLLMLRVYVQQGCAYCELPFTRYLHVQQRTEWHDLLGRHCPRFGRHQVVTVPIQRPAKWVPDDDYKLMLSFDCTLLVTHLQGPL